ncbi:hypothetical protein NE237_024486 [Protea cynaroides]|uniref:Uncharacterized protein n=1 Tax=Protea cynaroides TaxID=273540 RepID=A0A9Q0H184_9MAGN|nr:hypothetical protein NE237_024486 [Protea cynaroides]
MRPDQQYLTSTITWKLDDVRKPASPCADQDLGKPTLGISGLYHRDLESNHFCNLLKYHCPLRRLHVAVHASITKGISDFNRRLSRQSRTLKAYLSPLPLSLEWAT